MINENRKVRVFVSGPLTTGHMLDNSKKAIDVAEMLYQAGYVPVIPHLMILWGLVHNHPWGEWMGLCLELVKGCDAVYRFPGISKGAEVEEKTARKLKIPVFRNIETLKREIPPDRFKK